jgi:hypothetical protein
LTPELSVSGEELPVVGYPEYIEVMKKGDEPNEITGSQVSS